MGLLTSKKFWTAVLGVAAVVISALTGLPEEAVITIGGMVIALLVGQGLTDVGKAAKMIDKGL